MSWIGAWNSDGGPDRLPSGTITITVGVNDKIDLSESISGNSVVTITPGTYTRVALGAQIGEDITNFASDNSYASSYNSSTMKFTIQRDLGAATFSLLWKTGPNTLTTIGPFIGFPTLADSTGALTYTGAVVP